MTLKKAEFIWEKINQLKELKEKVRLAGNKYDEYNKVSSFFHWDYKPGWKPTCELKKDKNKKYFIHIKNNGAHQNMNGTDYDLYFDVLDDDLIKKLKADKDFLYKMTKKTVYSRAENALSDESDYSIAIVDIEDIIENEV